MSVPRAERSAARSYAPLFLGLFAIIFAVRLALVLTIAPEMPYYDEWDGVIDSIGRPLLAGNFSPAFFIHAHNEHVLFFTKVLSYLFLCVGDNQFDNVPVCELSQLLYCAVAAALIAMGANAVGRFRWPFLIGSLLIAALPYGWENIGMGWGNPYYFLVAFSAAAILIACRSEATIVSCVFLVAFLIAAGVSMASGVLACAIVAAAAALRWRCALLSGRRAVVLIALACAAALLNAMFAIYPGNTALSFGAVQIAETMAIAALWWPTWMVLRNIWRREATTTDIALVCFALWGVLQIGSILLARPGFRLWFPVSRYIEIIGLGAFANLGCLCRLALTSGAGKTVSAAAWIATRLVIATAIVFAPFAWRWMDRHAQDEREQTVRLIRYIGNGDTAAIADAVPASLPYPSRERLRSLIDAQDVRFILGDRIGTRPAPAVFVERVRRFNSMLTQYGAGLMFLALLGGLSLLVRAWRRESLRVSGAASP